MPNPRPKSRRTYGERPARGRIHSPALRIVRGRKAESYSSGGNELLGGGSGAGPAPPSEAGRAHQLAKKLRMYFRSAHSRLVRTIPVRLSGSFERRQLAAEQLEWFDPEVESLSPITRSSGRSPTWPGRSVQNRLARPRRRRQRRPSGQRRPRAASRRHPMRIRVAGPPARASAHTRAADGRELLRPSSVRSES
jgi:hypothetical protein